MELISIIYGHTAVHPESTLAAKRSLSKQKNFLSKFAQGLVIPELFLP